MKTKLGYQDIAGCHVMKGQLNRKYKVKIMRDGECIKDGIEIAQLKHFKEDVVSINKGNDCGLALEGNIDFEEGDLVICYQETVYVPKFYSQTF